MGPKEAKEIMLSKRNCQQNIHGVRGGRAGRSRQGEAKAAAGVGGGNRARGGRARGNGPPAGTAAARGCSSTSRSSRWCCSARPGRGAAAGPRGRGRARALQNQQLHQLRPPAQRLRLPQGGAGRAEAGSGPGPGGGGTAGPAAPPLPQPALPPRPDAAARAPRAPDRRQQGQAGGRPGGALPPAQRLPAAAHHLGLRLRRLGRRPDPAAAPGAATCAADSRPEPHGPGAVGQFHRSLRRRGFPPYSYVTSSHDRSTFPMKSLDRTPVPRGIWQNSLGMHPGQVETSPMFSEKRSGQFGARTGTRSKRDTVRDVVEAGRIEGRNPEEESPREPPAALLSANSGASQDHKLRP
ncbi:uncharacterized protein LOC141584363 [Saimiri boliviensis]|uniref:uncharacterized protein LOC141584363 n=1 Tax=Saimiri boliviensis TaxID=27679 RepID=UPI003D778CB3